MERGGADRRAGGAGGPRDAGARGAGPGDGPHRAARCAGGGRGRGRGAGAGAARGRAGPPQAGGGAARGRRAGGRAAAGGGGRAAGGSGGHHRRAGPPAHPSRRMPRDARRQGAFLECAQYAGEWYGTLKSEVTRLEERGRHVLLDIEVQGAAQIRAQYPPQASVGIFVLPPSPRALIQRLRRRESESADSLVRRLERAVSELREAPALDYIVVNDKLATAVGTVGKIIDGDERR